MLTKLYKPREFDKEQGFTLIELLVVIVIIGILAAIALPIFLNQQKAAQAASVKSDARNTVVSVKTALVKTPDASGFVLLQSGDTASYSLIQTPLTHAAVVPVPAGEVAVNVVQSKDNVTVITDHAHAGSDALSTLASATPDWQSWVVHSESKITGAYTEFDSTTGQYASNTNSTPVGSSYTPVASGSTGGTGSGGTGGTGGNSNNTTLCPTTLVADNGAANATIPAANCLNTPIVINFAEISGGTYHQGNVLDATVTLDTVTVTDQGGAQFNLTVDRSNNSGTVDTYLPSCVYVDEAGVASSIWRADGGSSYGNFVVCNATFSEGGVTYQLKGFGTRFDWDSNVNRQYKMLWTPTH